MKECLKKKIKPYKLYSYQYYNKKDLPVDINPPMCIIAEKAGNHKNGGNIAFSDCCVIFLKDHDYTPEKYLGKTREQINAIVK